jgi:transposase
VAHDVSENWVKFSHNSTIEADIRGGDPATRPSMRQARSTPILARLDDWLLHHHARASAKSPLGAALAYIAKYRDGLGHFMSDGRVEIGNKTVERSIRPIALNRKNALFAGHDAGAENWAVIASLIETCKMNAIDPHAQFTRTLTAIVSGHKQSQVDDLLPWNYAANV